MRSKQVGEKAGKSRESPNRKLLRSKMIGGKVGKSRKSPNRKLLRSELGEKLENRENPPTGS